MQMLLVCCWFGILTVEAGLDELALQAAFRRGLSKQVRDALFAWTQPVDLDGLIVCGIEIDN